MLNSYSALYLTLFIAAFCVTATGFKIGKAQASDNPAPVVVELYTSQSCSSCPPADKILQSLTQNENLIVLSCHVSYWNRLNWVDTLSREFCDIRQHGYASLTTRKRIYTPQMVVNGINMFVGSRADQVKSALIKGKNQGVQPITISSSDDLINFELPAAGEKWGNDFRLWMYGYKKETVQEIGSGENRGKTVKYVNAAITYDNLGAWEGGAVSKSVQTPQDDIDGVVIFAQTGGYGRIVAAGKLEFSKEENPS